MDLHLTDIQVKWTCEALLESIQRNTHALQCMSPQSPIQVYEVLSAALKAQQEVHEMLMK